MRDKTTAVVEFPRGVATSGHQRFGELDQRIVQFGQVARLRRPVVHLQVDVGVVVGVPRCIDVLVPNALQVGRQRSGATAANQQVATELEVGRQQVRIRLALLDERQALVGWQLPLFMPTDIQGHAIKPTTVFADLATAQMRDANRLSQRDVQQRVKPWTEVALLARAHRLEVGRRGQQERHLVGVFDVQHRFVASRRQQLAAVVHHPQHRRERRALVLLAGVGAPLHRQGHAVDLDLDRPLALHAGLHGHRTGLVRRQMHHDHVVLGLREHLPGERRVADLVGHLDDAVAQVEHAPVVGRLLMAREQKIDVAQGLVASDPPLRHELLLHQLLGLPVLAGKQQFPGLRQVGLRADAVPVDGRASPQRIDVALDAFGSCATEHHRPQMAVADRQGLIPVLGGLAIPERRRGVLGSGSDRKRRDNQSEKGTHRPIMTARPEFRSSHTSGATGAAPGRQERSAEQLRPDRNCVRT